MTQTRADRSADLTSGPMLQKIILFSIPLAASSILQLLFNAADVVVVGRFAGSTALAAVMEGQIRAQPTALPHPDAQAVGDITGDMFQRVGNEPLRVFVIDM